MTRIAWATDIHLEFADDRGRGSFIEQLREAEPDVVILAGDIGTAESVEDYLAEIDDALDCPVRGRRFRSAPGRFSLDY